MVKPAKQVPPEVDDSIPSDALMTDEEVEERIAHYEKLYGFSSEEFLKRRKEGTAPDSFEAMAWMMMLKFR
jgi:hypothetical protein